MTRITLKIPLEERQNEITLQGITKDATFPKSWLHGYDLESRSITFKGVPQGYKTEVCGSRFEITAPDGKKGNILLKNIRAIDNS